MRYFFFAFLLLIVTVIGVAGFRGSKSARQPIEIFNDMDHQAKKKAQSESDFFANGQNSRPPVPGTLPIGYELSAKPFSAGGAVSAEAYSIGDDYQNTGKMGEFYGHGIPLPVDEALLSRGQERYGIYCAICHGAAGDGTGVVSKYGVPAANLILPPIGDPKQRPDGNVFDVITNGKGNMGRYAAQLNVRDRWAVVAYVRVLQQRSKLPEADVKEAYEAWQKTQGAAPAAVVPAQPNKAS